MRFMNQWDIDRALTRYATNETPNRARLAVTVACLAEWANRNSDGWAYWPKPARSAAKAMELLEGDYTNAALNHLCSVDATDAETTKALSPIKAFLTRQGVPHSEIIAPVQR